MGRGISKGKAKSCHRLLHAQVCRDGGCKKVGVSTRQDFRARPTCIQISSTYFQLIGKIIIKF